jgi:voltage-gated potassium channel
MRKIKQNIGLILNDDTPETTVKKRIGFFILFLILVSSFQVILESVVSLNLKYYHQFFIIDTAVSILFSIEYILRLWTYRIDGEKPTISQRISNITSFYMVIDLISIIPFYLSLFIPTGYGFMRIIRILRLFRLIKFGRYMKSQNLVVNAIKNKSKELMLSMQAVVFLTVILSAILYHIENSVQPNNFGDIVDAFVWSLSKFIGGIGGYGDFSPITVWGQVIATIVGILGIALFAVPAGIIGAGFVEEIEAIKTNEELKEKNEKLLTAFNYENQAAAIKIKRLIGLSHIRRRFIRLTSAEFKLTLSRADLINIADKGRGVKLTTVNNIEVIQSFDENSIYGTLNNRGSSITVISSSSATQQYLGHFTYAVSEYLNANYISSEHVSKSVWDPKYKCGLYSNPLYLSGETSDNIYFKQFKKDILETTLEKSTVIYFLCSAAKNGSFHILNGGIKGENKFTSEESTFENINGLESFYTSFDKSLKEFDKTEGKIYSTINKHKFYGNQKKDRFHWLLRKEKNANIICIYLSPKILEAEPGDYYSIIKILGDNIKEHLIPDQNKQ